MMYLYRLFIIFILGKDLVISEKNNPEISMTFSIQSNIYSKFDILDKIINQDFLHMSRKKKISNSRIYLNAFSAKFSAFFTTPTISPSMQTIISTNAPTVVKTVYPTSPNSTDSNSPTMTTTIESALSPTFVPSIDPLIIPQPTLIPSFEQFSTIPSPHPSSILDINSIPTILPTTLPIQESITPMNVPTYIPTVDPTNSFGDQSDQVSITSTKSLSNSPSVLPSLSSTSESSDLPTLIPTQAPLSDATRSPSFIATSTPSAIYSNEASIQPSLDPVRNPSPMITTIATQSPISATSISPTTVPQPSYSPSLEQLSINPSPLPSSIIDIASDPSFSPTTFPVLQSISPLNIPTYSPSVNPTSSFGDEVSMTPTMSPSKSPSVLPSPSSTSLITLEYSINPSRCPSSISTSNHRL